MFSSLGKDRGITAGCESNLAMESLKAKQRKQEEQKTLLTILKNQQGVDYGTPLVVAVCEPSEDALYNALSNTLGNDKKDGTQGFKQLITTTFKPENFTEQCKHADSLKNPEDYSEILALSRFTNIQDIELLRIVSAINTAMMIGKNFDERESADKKVHNREKIVNQTMNNGENTIDQKKLKDAGAVCIEKAPATVYRLNKQGIDANIIYGNVDGEGHAAVSLRHNGQSFLFDVANPIQTVLGYIPSIEANNTARNADPNTAISDNNLSMNVNNYRMAA